jgi:hypothetical protein
VLLECQAAWKIKAGTNFLSNGQAQLIAERDHFGSARFKETCNKLSTLLEKAGRSTLKSSDANKFVQAPVALKIESEEYVKIWSTPSRLQRRKERAVVQAGQKLTAEPIEKPRVLLVTPVALSSDRSPSMTRDETNPNIALPAG